MSVKIAIIYFSMAGHTKKVAEYIMSGAKEYAGSNVELINCENLDEMAWNKLDNADAIIFGCPTYMGSIPAQFKAFIDAASPRWYQRKWLNKIGGGFTNSGGLSGDKALTLFSLMTNAMQHGMIWVGQSELSPSQPSKIEDINRLSGYTGLMTQSNNEAIDITPPSGDLSTAKKFGYRVAEITARFRS